MDRFSSIRADRVFGRNVKNINRFKKHILNHILSESDYSKHYLKIEPCKNLIILYLIMSNYSIKENVLHY